MVLARSRAATARLAADERRRRVPELEARFASAVGRYFRGMLPRIEPGIRRVLDRRAELGTKRETALERELDLELRTIDWNAETRILSVAVRPVTTIVVDAAVEASSVVLSESLSLGGYQVDRVIDDVGRRIASVSDTSRQRIAAMAADGIEKGLSVEQIVRGVRPGTSTIAGPVPTFPGIRNLVDSWSSTGAAGFAGRTTDVPLSSSRAYLIAQTETGNAYNNASLETYRRSGIVDFVEVFDGPDCGWSTHDDPDLAHGSIRSIDQARARPLSHPRCQRAFGPAIGATSSRPSPFERGAPVPGANAPTSRTPSAAVARDTIGRARGAEPAVSAAMRGPVDGRTIKYGDAMKGTPAPKGGDLAGYENRLKSVSSMERKLNTEIHEARAAGLDLTPAGAAERDAKDAVRYTYRFNGDEYGDGSLGAARELYRAGNRPDAWKDTWDSTVYRGVNSNWTTPDGTRFEVQFHTPESFVAKERNHAEYEEAREVTTNAARRAELEAIMSSRTGGLVAPSRRVTSLEELVAILEAE